MITTEQIFNFVNEHYILSALFVVAALVIIHQLYHFFKKRKTPEIKQEPVQQAPQEFYPQEIDWGNVGITEEPYEERDIVDISKEQLRRMNTEIINKASEFNEKLNISKALILQEEKKVYEEAQRLIRRKNELAKTREVLEKSILKGRK